MSSNPCLPPCEGIIIDRGCSGHRVTSRSNTPKSRSRRGRLRDHDTPTLITLCGCRTSPHVLHQGHRAPRAAARGRGAAPHQPQTPPGVGGPGRVRRARPAAAASAALPSPGHPGHHPALASPSCAHRDGPIRTRPDGHRSTRRSRRWSCGWRRRTWAGDTAECRASCSSSATGSAPRRSGGSSSATGSHRRRVATQTPRGGSSCVPKPLAWRPAGPGGGERDAATTDPTDPTDPPREDPRTDLLTSSALSSGVPARESNCSAGLAGTDEGARREC